jgi:hypothetical protein
VYATHKADNASTASNREAAQRSAAVCAGENVIISQKIRPIIDFLTIPRQYPPNATQSQIVATDRLNAQALMLKDHIEKGILTPIDCAALVRLTQTTPTTR